MTKRNTSIRINGSHYDALTGALLSKPVGKSMDGVVNGTTTKSTAVKAALAKPAAAPKTVSARTTAAHAKAHNVKPSATLMRHAVAKPTNASLKRHTKVQASTQRANQVTLTSHITVAPKLSLHSVDKKRAARASAVAISPRIGRFAHKVGFTASQEVGQAVSALDKAIIIPQNPTAPRIVIARQTSDIFEQALLRATSHEQPAPVVTNKGRRATRSLRRRMVSFSAGAVAVLALVGVFGYHSDNVQFKLASNRAGFAATMPSYQAKGFSVADVQVISGYLNVNYKNPSLGRTYAVTEKPSFWDSETLLNNITAGDSHTTYATVQKSGRTVYVYGKNQAAWVNNGILYQVLGNGVLSTQEFAQIAASM